MSFIEISGRIVFDPPDVTKKHLRQSWKRTAYVLLSDDICEYYAWFIRKRYRLWLNKPLRSTHCTIINDKIEDLDSYNLCKKKYENTNLNITYNTDVRTNGKVWWLNVICNDAGDIREYANISRIPYFGLHITIGTATALRLNHSIYIHNLIKTGKNQYN